MSFSSLPQPCAEYVVATPHLRIRRSAYRARVDSFTPMKLTLNELHCHEIPSRFTASPLVCFGEMIQLMQHRADLLVCANSAHAIEINLPKATIQMNRKPEFWRFGDTALELHHPASSFADCATTSAERDSVDLEVGSCSECATSK